jgi:Zn-dependent protease
MNQAMTQPASSALCGGCGTEVAAGLLACPVCHKLVHGAELARLASEAREAEERGDFTAALGTWRKTLELLPQGTAQRTTIDAQMKRLSAMLDGRAPKPQPKNTGRKAGAVATTGAVGAALLKSKAILVAVLANGKFLLLGLLKLPTLLSMIVYANLTGGRGIGLSIGIVAAIYVHEVGHVATLRRYGIDASAPMFIPGFGALVRLRQYPTDAHEEARTGLAGPLWGLFASGVALAIGAAIHSQLMLTIASWSGTINIFNLTPVWQLDGARGLKALSKTQRILVGAIAIAVALLTSQPMPGIVGVLVLGRAFVGASHPEGDRGMLTLFASLVVVLPAVVWMANLLRVGL